MIIMTSIIRVGQSKFVTATIDEDSLERIMNCVQTLSELETVAEVPVHDIFLADGRRAYEKMLGAQEKRAAEKKEVETTKEEVVQVDDLLTFRQFSKKTADDVIDVRHCPLLAREIFLIWMM
jgi:coatomer subunit beta